MAEPDQIVVCGLDGVIALLEHRLHHLHNEAGVRDWDAFHAACPDDMPNLPLIQRLRLAREAGFPVILLSGRSAAVREQTEAWLRHWNVGYDALWLRPQHDRVPADNFKSRIIERHFAGRRIRRVYESAQHLDFARWCTRQSIPCTLFGPNQGNSAERELFDLKTIRHVCGHVMLYPFYGDDDYSWKERHTQLAEGACMLCHAEERAAERTRRAADAALAARERGLPPLEGSERQVAWAEGIRLAAFGSIDKVGKWLAENGAQAGEEDLDHWEAVKQGVARATAFLQQQIDAKWWIEHRQGIASSLDAGRALLSSVAEEQGYF